MKVNILQFDIKWLDPAKNLLLIQKEIEALGEEVDLVVLPEMCLSGFCMEPEKAAVLEYGDEVKKLISIASENQVAIIGSLTIEEGGKYYNRVLLMDKSGIIGRYDKQYLFSPSGENDAFSIKYVPELIEFRGWKILPQVCYDLRFPENVRQLSAPDILIYMANWPTPRIHHWDALLRARAIENQCYVIACNRVGVDGNNWDYPGHSKMITYDGQETNHNAELPNAGYTLSKSDLESYRKKYKFLGDKKMIN